MLIAETFRLGLTPVYVNGLDAHAKRVASSSGVELQALIYLRAFPKYAPGKVLQPAPIRLFRTERESAIQKKQSRAWGINPAVSCGAYKPTQTDSHENLQCQTGRSDA
jgi:hypothetical protein